MRVDHRKNPVVELSNIETCEERFIPPQMPSLVQFENPGTYLFPVLVEVISLASRRNRCDLGALISTPSFLWTRT